MLRPTRDKTATARSWLLPQKVLLGTDVLLACLLAFWRNPILNLLIFANSHCLLVVCLKTKASQPRIPEIHTLERCHRDQNEQMHTVEGYLSPPRKRPQICGLAARICLSQPQVIALAFLVDEGACTSRIQAGSVRISSPLSSSSSCASAPAVIHRIVRDHCDPPFTRHELQYFNAASAGHTCLYPG